MNKPYSKEFKINYYWFILKQFAIGILGVIIVSHIFSFPRQSVLAILLCLFLAFCFFLLVNYRLAHKKIRLGYEDPFLLIFWEKYRNTSQDEEFVINLDEVAEYSEFSGLYGVPGYLQFRMKDNQVVQIYFEERQGIYVLYAPLRREIRRILDEKHIKIKL